MNMRTSMLSLFVVLAGCGGGGVMMMTYTPPGTTCLQSLQCIVACPENDEPCAEACNAKGTPQAQTQVIDLARCIETASCSDSSCVTTNCSTELTTCIGQSIPETDPGAPIQGGNVPAGSVPSNMVGSWAGARYGQTERLVFNADGTARWESSTTSQYYACLYISGTYRTGTAVITDKTITFHAAQIEDRIHDCAGPDEVTQKAAATAVIEYSVSTSDPNELLIVDEACAAKYPEARNNCMYAGCPIGLYCTSRIRRE